MSKQHGSYRVIKCWCGEDAYLEFSLFDEENDEICVTINYVGRMFRDRLKHAWRAFNGTYDSWEVITSPKEIIKALEALSNPTSPGSTTAPLPAEDTMP